MLGIGCPDRHALPRITPKKCTDRKQRSPPARAGSFNGASRPLWRIPAIVSFLNPKPALSLGRGNWSSCPIADARLATSECLLVGVKPSDQAGASFSDADPKRSSAMLPRNPSKPLCRGTGRPRPAPTSGAPFSSAPRECKQVLVKLFHMRDGQTVRGVLIDFELAA